MKRQKKKLREKARPKTRTPEDQRRLAECRRHGVEETADAEEAV
jgi:hypothetical protein